MYSCFYEKKGTQYRMSWNKFIYMESNPGLKRRSLANTWRRPFSSARRAAFMQLYEFMQKAWICMLHEYLHEKQLHEWPHECLHEWPDLHGFLHAIPIIQTSNIVFFTLILSQWPLPSIVDFAVQVIHQYCYASSWMVDGVICPMILLPS